MLLAGSHFSAHFLGFFFLLCTMDIWLEVLFSFVVLKQRNKHICLCFLTLSPLWLLTQMLWLFLRKKKKERKPKSHQNLSDSASFTSV